MKKQQNLTNKKLSQPRTAPKLLWVMILVGLILVVSISFGYAIWGTQFNQTETHGLAVASTGSDTSENGINITFKGNLNTYNLTTVWKEPGVTADTCYVRNTASTLLCTGSFIGDACALTNCLLTNNTDYHVGANKTLTSHTTKIFVSGNWAGSFVDLTGGYVGASPTSQPNGRNIRNLTFFIQTGNATVLLNSPANKSFIINSSIVFNSSVVSFADLSLINATLYLWNASSLFNQTTNLITGSGITNITTWNVTNLRLGEYNWNVYSCGNETTGDHTCGWASVNRTFTWGYRINSQSYNTATYSGALENFTLNITIPLSTSLSSIKLFYNNTLFNVDSADNYPNGYYVVRKQISVPITSVQAVKNFTWQILFTDGVQFNTTTNTQTVNSFLIDDCSTYTIKVLNYTLYDEITEKKFGAGDNGTIQTDINLYNLDYSTSIGSLSLNTSNGNLLVCVDASIQNITYYLDALTQYGAGSQYVTRFNNIQKHLVSNATIPIVTPIYTLNSSLSTEFLVTFKDENFIKDPNVLVDVSKKYVSQGVFKTVEVPKTDDEGKAVIHLQEGVGIYTLTFKKFGVVLATINNIVPKCDSSVLAQCYINANAYSSTINFDNFDYVNGIKVIQTFNQDTRTVTATFTSQSGTNLVSLNVTKFDRFGNQTVCSTSVTSSSGSISCAIPSSFGNVTVISKVYSNGLLSSSSTFSIKISNPDTSSSTVILAIMIIITLSMLFISDLRGILLGCFIGLLLMGALLYIDQGSLFSIGTSLTWATIIIVIIMWKITKKEEG